MKRTRGRSKTYKQRIKDNRKHAHTHQDLTTVCICVYECLIWSESPTLPFLNLYGQHYFQTRKIFFHMMDFSISSQ